MLRGINKAFQRLALLKNHLFQKKESPMERVNKLKARARQVGFDGNGILNLCLWANVNSEEKDENVLGAIEAFIAKRESSYETFRYAR